MTNLSVPEARVSCDLYGAADSVLFCWDNFTLDIVTAAIYSSYGPDRRTINQITQTINSYLCTLSGLSNN